MKTDHAKWKYIAEGCYSVAYRKEDGMVAVRCGD